MGKLDLSRPVQTRAGLPVRIFATDYKDKDHPEFTVVGAALRADGDEWLTYWKPDGSWHHFEIDHEHDLINTPQRIKRRVWLNVYADTATVYSTRESANSFANRKRLACIPIDIDAAEGEGL